MPPSLVFSSFLPLKFLSLQVALDAFLPYCTFCHLCPLNCVCYLFLCYVFSTHGGRCVCSLYLFDEILKSLWISCVMSEILISLAYLPRRSGLAPSFKAKETQFYLGMMVCPFLVQEVLRGLRRLNSFYFFKIDKFMKK